jgi:serine protease Do
MNATKIKTIFLKYISAPLLIILCFGTSQAQTRSTALSDNSKDVHSSVKLPEVKAGQPLPSDLFIQLAKNVSPSVVNIYTETKPKLNYSEGMPDGFQMFFEQFLGQGGGNPRQGQGYPQAQPAQSLGTGFIINSNGLILTNAHVVNGADVIKVNLSGGTQEYKAKVIGADTETDVALIKIETKKQLVAAKLGTSKDLQVGEWVAAFGNPYGHSNTMTKGIVSALGRDSGNLNLFPFIQTDASINPGNSGGPLVNVKGEVIGMNTAIDARAQGIGFAIPIDNVKKILSELETTGGVQRGFLGVEMQGLDEQSAQSIGVPITEGALIVNVLPGSAAANAGLKPYDVVVQFGATKVTGPSDLFKAVASSPIGEIKNLEVYRGGKKITLSATIGSKQKEIAATNKEEKTNSEGSYNLEALGAKLGKNTNSNSSSNFRFGSAGVLIEAVKPYSPAFNFGLKAGDVILEVNKTTVSSPSDVKRLLQSQNIFRIQRGERMILLMLNL